ncbi:MAG: hypothetical protein ABIT71_13635 [Vicinamibacteraceae bacterium]
MARRSRRILALPLVATLASWAASCGGSPAKPTPSPSVTSAASSTANTPPIVAALTAQGARRAQPPALADAGEELVVTAAVTDAETPVDRLTFAWSSSAGSFSGQGPTVRWRAPASVPAPLVATLRLEVVDGDQRVERTLAVHVHDHVREVGDMATLFLSDFSNSATPVGTVMRNFLPGCYGTADETSDVEIVRRNFLHVSTRLDPPAVTVEFDGRCPYENRAGDACSVSFVRWETRKIPSGEREVVEGRDQVAAVYRQDRWWLCDSRWDGRRVSGSGTLQRLLMRQPQPSSR